MIIIIIIIIVIIIAIIIVIIIAAAAAATTATTKNDNNKSFSCIFIMQLISYKACLLYSNIFHQIKYEHKFILLHSLSREGNSDATRV
jgi:hypothetical protein